MAQRLIALLLGATGIVGLVLLLDAVLGPVYASLLLAPMLWGSLVWGLWTLDRRVFPSVQGTVYPPRRVDGPVIDVHTTPSVCQHRPDALTYWDKVHQ